MAYVLGGSFGGVFEAASLSVIEQQYDPVYGTAIDTSFLWNLLGSYYRTVMADHEVFEAVWDAMLRVQAADLLHLWEVDYSKSLRDVPVYSQRMWLKYEFMQDVAFTEDPGFLEAGTPDMFAYGSSELASVWTNRAALSDGAWLELRGEVTEAASLAWTARMRFDAVERHGTALCGYGSSTATGMAGMILAGVVGDSSSEDAPYPVLVHLDPAGGLTYRKAAAVLSTEVEYDFVVAYRAADGALTLEVLEVEAVKVSGVSGYTGDENEIYSSEFADDTAEFVSEGVVPGDYLVYAGTSYEILTVTETTLTVTTGLLPASATGLSYEVRGAHQVAALAMTLPAVAADPGFTVDRFGTCAFDLRHRAAGFIGTVAVANRRRVRGAVTGLSYFDPVDANTVVSVPLLQDKVGAPTAMLYEGTDFTIQDSVFLFQEPPTAAWWAPYARYDEAFIENNFGVAVGLSEASSEDYLAKVRGLFYAYYKGPTPAALRTGVQIMLGLPIAASAGAVEAVNPSYSGQYGQIVIGGKGYLYPLAVGTDLVVGDEVDAYQPLSLGVEIRDWLSHPEWFLPLGLSEIEKYHTFCVLVNLDAFNTADLTQAASFVERLRPTWKSALFVGYKEVADTIDIDDSMTVAIAYTLVDTLCSGPLVAYDDAEWEGDEADWRFDQGEVDWEATSAAMRGSAVHRTKVLTLGLYGPAGQRERLSGVLTLTDASAVVLGTGTAFLSEIGGPGAVADTYLLFEDPVTGELATWCRVLAVLDDETLTLTAAFSGDTGDYLAALGDPDYRKVYFDQYHELHPEERLTVVLGTSPGIAETMLTGRASCGVGETWLHGELSDWLAEIGSGAVVDKYVVFPDGEWVRVSFVDDPESATLASPAPATHTEVLIFLADDVLAGTLDFLAGSATVATTDNLVGVVAPGDCVQAVPGSGPVVEVQSVAAGSLTLVDDYPGADALGTKAINRGAWSDVVTGLGDLTGWYGTAGGTATYQVPEESP